MPIVTGTFVEGGAGPIAGWPVSLSYFNILFGWLPLANPVATSASGEFSFDVPFLTAVFDGVGTVEVRLFDPAGRIAAQTRFALPKTGTHPLGTITVVSANLRGWRATNLDPGGTAPRVSTNNTVEPLIDNEVAWSALHDAVAGAEKEIALQLFYFDVEKVFAVLPNPPPNGAPTKGTRLEEDLVAAAMPPRKVNARLLIRDHSPLPYPIHTADPVVEYFKAAGAVTVRRYRTDPRLPMHAKFVVVDGTEAHLTGSPLLQEYFDGSKHQVSDARRGPLSGWRDTSDLTWTLGGAPWPPSAEGVGGLPIAALANASKNSIRDPVHDVGARIHGDAVRDLHDTFFLHWNRVGAPESSKLTPAPPPPATSTSAIQIVRSLPRDTFPGLPEGEASILESYQRCFAQASDFIYLENQYVLEYLIYDAIRLSLRRAPTLQIILLTNHKLDIPLYQRWQTNRMSQLIANLTADKTIDRFGAFTLWSYDDVQPPRILPNYVHTKVGIADDCWATLGSANLDGASLMTGEWIAAIPGIPFLGMENRRSTEVNATVFSGVDGFGASTVPADLRRALWAEHLGLKGGPADPLLATRPAGGWLELWNSHAKAKLKDLNAIPPTANACRVLKWQPPKEPGDYLKSLGVDVRKFDVLSEFRGFDFTTGTWQPGHA